MLLTFSLIISTLALIVVGSAEYISIDKGKQSNELCSTSEECLSTLVCHRQICHCISSDYWNGTTCELRREVNVSCENRRQCKETLDCRENTCQCHDTDYWNGGYCVNRKTAGMPCSDQKECQDDFLCSNKTCNCPMSEYLDEDECFQRKEYKSPCETTVQCKDTLNCFNEQCQCDKSNYWKGNVCVQRKRIDATCIVSTDCYDNLKCSNGICVCNLDKAYWDGVACIYRPSECEDLNDTVDGVYPMYPGGNARRTYVYCIMRDNKKWTVIQRRYDGTVNFYRDLYEYTRGFGIVYKEHWFGNMKIRRITQDGTHELSVHLEDWNGNQRKANYSQFSVGSKKLYTLSASGYSGTAGDSLKYHNSKSFYTKNKGSGCTENLNNEVWYSNCQYSNLNGKYNGTGETGFVWNGFGVVR